MSERLYLHKTRTERIMAALREKNPPNNIKVLSSSKCQKSKLYLSSDIENEKKMVTHNEAEILPNFRPDPDLIDELFQKVESNIPLNLETNVNDSTLISSDIATKCYSYQNGSPLKQLETINSKTCDHLQENNLLNDSESIAENGSPLKQLETLNSKTCAHLQENNLLNDSESIAENDSPLKQLQTINSKTCDHLQENYLLNDCESIAVNNEKSIKVFESIQSNYTLSEFEEDDDDSIKDPNFKSSSSSSDSSSSSSSSSDEEVVVEKNPTKKNTRKRQRCDADHKKNKAKTLRNAGKEYESSAKSKKTVPAKKIKDACKESCIFKCRSKISEIQRIQIFTDYYNLSDVNRKRDFLLKHMELMPPNERLKENKRRPNYAFHFQTENGMKMRVCKLFFKNTLDVNDRTILTVRNKTTSSGSLTGDMRGKHKNHKKLDEEIKKAIRIHINSIPRVESHYLRAQTSKEFIDGSKCIADLYRDYKDLCESDGRPFGKYHMYADIFNEEFNISFFKPKKDQCSLCYQYKHANDQIKETLKKNYEDHQLEKKMSRHEKASDKNKISETFVVACFDMQAILPLPKGEISIFYSKSKVNVMNLTVTEIGSEDACCYIWHEGEGGKGATEVSSCIFKYLEEKSNALNNEDLEITFYSDNCGAQNKNRYLIAILMYAVQILKIKRVYHKYLIAGHTQNEGDGSHSTIEKELRKTIRYDPIYTPDQFISVIRNSRKQKKPFVIRELTHKDFHDVKQLAADIGNNFEKNVEKEQVFLSQIKLVKVERTNPYMFFYKNSYYDTQWKCVNIKQRKTTRGSGSTAPSSLQIELKKAYNSKRPINENKKKDLKYLFDKHFIPDFYRQFYESLF